MSRSIEPGLYTLAQAATRLNVSTDFLREHQGEFRCVRLSAGPKARLHFPVHFIEAIIAGEAEPLNEKPARTKPRLRAIEPGVALLPVKGEAA